MLARFLACMLVLGAPMAAMAEDTGPDLSVGLAVSYTHDFGDPDTSLGVNNNSLFYSSLEPGSPEAFNFDLLQLGLSGARGNFSYSAKVNFGDLARFSEDSLGVGTNDGDIGLHEAYLSYAFEDFVVTGGRFPTPIGYEVLEPWGNAQISRSRVWSLQPVAHDGINVSTTVGSVDVMVGVANSFFINDNVANDVDDGSKTLIGSLGMNLGDMADVSIGALWGDDQSPIVNAEAEQFLFNAIVSVPLEQAGLAVEFNWQEEEFDGGAFGDSEAWNVTGYAGTRVGPFTLDLRGDYGEIEQIGIDFEDLWSITATVGYPIAEGVTARVEYIHASSELDLFDLGPGADGDITTPGDNTADDTADILQFQIVWHPESL